MVTEWLLELEEITNNGINHTICKVINLDCLYILSPHWGLQHADVVPERGMPSCRQVESLGTSRQECRSAQHPATRHTARAGLLVVSPVPGVLASVG